MKIVQFPTSQVVYFRRVGQYGPENQAVMQVAKQWVKRMQLTAAATILGIALDDPQVTPATQCRYDVCVATTIQSKEPVTRRQLVGGRYACFKVAHTAVAIQTFYQQLPVYLAQYQLIMADKPVIERYQPQFVAQGWCELLVPVS